MGMPAIGFIGFGEAVYHISAGLVSEGLLNICAYDAAADDPDRGPLIRKRAGELGIVLVPSLEALCARSDIVLCATSAKSAYSVACSAKPFLHEKKLYVDMNAASSFVKQAIFDELSGTGVAFADAAIMEAVPGLWHRVPMNVSGNGAQSFVQFANGCGMKATYIDEQPGSASAVKMLRSIFMKGFSALMFETLAASEAMNATDLILASIEQTLRAKPLEETVNSLLTRTVVHAERRLGEMSEVIRTLEHLGVDATLSHAVKEKLGRFVEAGSSERYPDGVPGDYKEALKDAALFSGSEPRSALG